MFFLTFFVHFNAISYVPISPGSAEADIG